MKAMQKCSQDNHNKQMSSLDRFTKLREREYYFGEYLTQGRLDVRRTCARTSLQSMINAGLFELQLRLGEKQSWKDLAKRVVDLREPFVRSQNPPLTGRTKIRKAICIAQVCFGDRWTFPMAAMLLALQPREKDDRIIINGFLAMFTGKW